MKQCSFCTNNVKTVDYKDVETLKKFIDPLARVLNRRKSGTCAKHQRRLTISIKRARFLALLPFIGR